ncbi:MAG: STAS domain-containing protein [Pontibacterium sp.]
MSITAKHLENEKKVVIDVQGRFDFSLHADFRKAYKDCMAAGTSFQIDLGGAKYMDSSALGMILLLKEHAEKLGGKVEILRPNDAVKKILDIAKFDRLVNIG